MKNKTISEVVKEFKALFSERVTENTYKYPPQNQLDFLRQALQAERAKERERVIQWVEDNTTTFSPADSIWFGDDDYENGEFKLVPTSKKDAMYCLNCKRFLHEEGCNCGSIWKDDILQALNNQDKI